MTGLAISPAGTTDLPERAAKPVDGELREAAQQFEAILLRQMLASARNTGFAAAIEHQLARFLPEGDD